MRLKLFSCFACGVHRAGFGSRVLLLAAEFYVIEDSSTKPCTVVDKSQP